MKKSGLSTNSFLMISHPGESSGEKNTRKPDPIENRVVLVKIIPLIFVSGENFKIM